MSVDEVDSGIANRHTSATDYNEHSSRSHTIFQLVIESRPRTQADAKDTLPSTTPAHIATDRNRKSPAKGVRISTLNLIDLAGSEKASSSTERRREGAYINRSLLTLGTVISKLTGQDKLTSLDPKALHQSAHDSSKAVDTHIPYRDSKLTRILQPSLQGNARISVICTLSPSHLNIEESFSTLKFAQRVKKVVTRVEKNELVDEDKALLQQYRLEIQELKTKLLNLTAQSLPHYQSSNSIDELNSISTSQLQQDKRRLEEELQKQQLVRTAFKERINHLTTMILTSSTIDGSSFSSTPHNLHRHHFDFNQNTPVRPATLTYFILEQRGNVQSGTRTQT